MQQYDVGYSYDRNVGDDEFGHQVCGLFQFLQLFIYFGFDIDLLHSKASKYSVEVAIFLRMMCLINGRKKLGSHLEAFEPKLVHND